MAVVGSQRDPTSTRKTGTDQLSTTSSSCWLSPPRSSSSSTSSASFVLKGNETDELKMAKSFDVQVPGGLSPSSRSDAYASPVRTYVKKGSLQKQISGQKWQECSCVLTRDSLTCYQASKEESSANVLARISLMSSTRVLEVNIPNYFAFSVVSSNENHVFSAMTTGTRLSWIRAIKNTISETTSNTVGLQPSGPVVCLNGLSYSSVNNNPVPWGASRQENSAAAVLACQLPSYGNSLDTNMTAQSLTLHLPTERQWYPSSHHDAKYVQPSRIVGRRARPFRPNAREPESCDDSTTTPSISPKSTDEPISSCSSTPDMGSSFDSDRFFQHGSNQTAKRRDETDAVPDAEARTETSRLDWKPDERSCKLTPFWIDDGTRIGTNCTKDQVRNLRQQDCRAETAVVAPLSKHQPPAKVHRFGEPLLPNGGGDIPDLESLQIPSEPANVDEFLVSSLQAEVKLLEKQLNQAMQNLQTALSQKHQLETVASCSDSDRRKSEELSGELRRVEHELNAKNKALLTAYNEIDSLRRDLSTNVASVDALRHAVQKYEGQISALNETVQQKRGAIQQNEDSGISIKTLSQQLAKAVEDKVSLEQAARVKEMAMSVMEEKLADSENKAKKASTEMLTTTNEILRLRSELEKFTAENNQLKIELEKKKSELEKERSRTFELEADIAHLRNEQMDITASLGMETKNRLLKEDLERVESKLKLAEMENLKLMQAKASLEEAVDSLRSKLDSVTDELKMKDITLQKTETAKESAQKENNHLNRLISENESTIRKELESVRLQLHEEKAKNDLHVKMLEEGNIKLEQAEKMIQEFYSDLEAKDLELETETKKHQVYQQNTDKKIRDFKNENKDLKLCIQENEENTRHLEDELESFRRQCHELHNRLRASEANAGMDSELQQLRQRLDEKNSECLQVTSKLNSALQEKQSLEIMIDNLQKELKLKNEELRQSAQHRSPQKLEMNKMGSEGTETKQSFEWAVPDDVNELKHRYILATRQLRSLQRDLLQAESQQVAITDANATLKRDIRDMEIKYEDRNGQLSGQVKELSTKLAAAERRNYRLEQQCKLQNKDISSATVGCITDSNGDEVDRKYHPETSDMSRQDSAMLRVQQLEEQLCRMETNYENELATQRAAHQRALAQSKDDTLQLLASSSAGNIEINEESIRKRYTKETEHIKDIYDKGFGALERSHQRTMMEMRRTHKQEMEKLHKEKEELLKEEAQATQAVLDAMRKAHEAELQKERNKFLDLIAKTYCQADMESLQRQHEEDLELIQHEISLLSEQFSVKCLENAALSERLEAQTKTIHANCVRIHDLMSRNEELSTSFKCELERLGRIIEQQSGGNENGVHDTEHSNKVLLLKQAEIQQLKQELSSLKCELDTKDEELRDCRQMYDRLHTLLQDNSVIGSNESLMQSQCRAEGLSGVFLFNSQARGGSFSNADNSDMIVDDSELLARVSASPNVTYRVASSIGSDISIGSPRGSCRRKNSWRLLNPQRARTSPDVTTASSRFSLELHNSDLPTGVRISTASTDSLRSSGSELEVASTAM